MQNSASRRYRHAQWKKQKTCQSFWQTGDRPRPMAIVGCGGLQRKRYLSRSASAAYRWFTALGMGAFKHLAFSGHVNEEMVPASQAPGSAGTVDVVHNCPFYPLVCDLFDDVVKHDPKGSPAYEKRLLAFCQYRDDRGQALQSSMMWPSGSRRKICWMPSGRDFGPVYSMWASSSWLAARVMSETVRAK